MQIGWQWFALAWIINLLLFVWWLRLRTEVWANRRVIASLEAVVNQSAQKGRLKRTNRRCFGISAGCAWTAPDALQEAWR